MYIFSLEGYRKKDGSISGCLIIFLGMETSDADTINDAYVRWTASNVPPPTTLIIGCASKMLAFYNETADVSGYLTKLDRFYGFGRGNEVILAGFDHTGRVIEVANRKDEGHRDLTVTFNEAVCAHIATQIEETDVVIPAPLGTYFDKLSTRYSSHFIRAETLLESTACIEMLALRLLKPFNDWFDRARTVDVANIYVDTMGVWPVAEKLRQLHELTNPKSVRYQIDSFKSYDGLVQWDPPKRPAFVIVSATTSNGLAEQVRAKLGQGNAEIWTLLALAPVSGLNAQDQSVSFIGQVPRKLKGKPAMNGLREEFESNIMSISPGTETISIVGERFLSQPAKPKRVRLVHTKLETSTKEDLARLAKQHLVKVGRCRFDARTRWTISFDLPALIKSACIPEQQGDNSLLKSWLKIYSAPSPVAIVYPSADGSSAQEVAQAAVELAQLTEDTLKELTPSAEVFKLSSDELAKSSKPFPQDLKHCSVIVVAPVIGNGFIFKQISAMLRHKQPKGARLFLTLAALPESAAHLTQLNLDIANVATTDCHYEFKYQIALPIGRLDKAFNWAAELAVLRDLECELRDANISAKGVLARTRLLEDFALLQDNGVFLPSASEKPLTLSSGFFLWADSTEIAGEDFGGAVLLSISALLQAARSATAKVDDTSLKSGLFQHTLICPESFTRFNDAVIQAAILRAAYPAELNYSVSPEMSHDMARLLVKWLKYYNDPVGAAAGEFLFALAIGKLKLGRDDTKTVLNFARTCKGWLGCLAKVAESRVAGIG